MAKGDNQGRMQSPQQGGQMPQQQMGGFQGGGSNMLGTAQGFNGGTSPYGPTGGMPGMMGAIQGGAGIASRFMGNKPAGPGMGRFGQAMGQFGGQMGGMQPPGQMQRPSMQTDVYNPQTNPGGQNLPFNPKYNEGPKQPGDFGPSPDTMAQLRQRMGGNTGGIGLFGNRGGGGY